MQSNLIKVLIAGCFAVVYVVLVHFDLFHTCKGGWWCIHWAVVYIGVGAPILMGLLGFLFTKEKRIKHALVSFVAGGLAILIAMYAVSLLNDVRIAHDTKEGQEAEQELMQIISQKRILVDTASLDEQLQCVQVHLLQGQEFSISSNDEYRQLMHDKASKNCNGGSFPVIDFSQQMLIGKYTDGGGCKVDFDRRLYEDNELPRPKGTGYQRHMKCVST